MTGQNVNEQDAKLLRMAGEIHQFFSHQGDGAAAAAANHLEQFWAPAMRADFQAAIAAQGARADDHLHAIAKALQK